MKRVVATGTFDIIHPGHLYFLREAKKLGDWLGVVVSRDSTVLSIKGELPENDQNIRRRNIESLKIADVVVLGYPNDKYQIMQDLRPQVVALGYDQQAFTEDLKDKLEKRGIFTNVIRLPAFKPHIHKTSLLKEKAVVRIHARRPNDKELICKLCKRRKTDP